MQGKDSRKRPRFFRFAGGVVSVAAAIFIGQFTVEFFEFGHDLLVGSRVYPLIFALLLVAIALLVNGLRLLFK